MDRIVNSKHQRMLFIFFIVAVIIALTLSQSHVSAQDNPIDSSGPTASVPTSTATLPNTPTETAIPPSAALTAPTPVAPTGTISDSTPTFQWKRVTGATQYNFVLLKGTATVYSKTVASSTCGSNITYCVNTPTTVLSDASYTWKVRAYASGAWQAYSTVLAFKLVTIPTLSAPKGTISDTTPTFTWSRILNATQYSFTLYKGTTVIYTKTVATSTCGSNTATCSNTPTTVLTDATYTWKVRAYIGSAWQSYSPVTTFKLVSIPTITSPASTISDTTPTYKWTPIVNATQYSLSLLRVSTPVYTQTVASSYCTSSLCSYTPTTTLTDGSYRWRVRAYVGGVWQTYTAYTSFILKSIPTPLSPTGLQSSATPTFSWTPIVSATQYRYYLTQGSTTKSFVVLASACTATKCSATINEAIGLGAYSWYVKAFVGGVWQGNSRVLNFIINTNPYTGTGLLDGNGIPPDFFNDVHIRKAFSYCMDWDRLISENYGGEAVQSLELPMPDMVGYDADAPHYTLDLAKAEEEFKLADLDHDGIAAGDETDASDVWYKGFFVEIVYNNGNTTRQKIAEILATDLNAVNPLFNAQAVGIDWTEYIGAQRAHQIPVMTAGWQEDIHDPHNWFQPYTTGVYATRQNLPDDLKSQFQALINEAVVETDPTTRVDDYKQMTQLYYDNAVGVPIVLTKSHVYEQRTIAGRVLNQLFPGIYFYPLSKTGGADTTSVVYATASDIDTLDPALAYDTSSGNIIQNVYDTLVFYKGDSTQEFVPQLATSVPTTENGGISEDGKTITFHIRTGVKFQNDTTLTPSDVAYTFQRGLLQGGSGSPQLLLTEAFFGTGIYDVTSIIDPSGALLDNRSALQAVDSATLISTCQQVKDAIVADDTAGTVTFHLAQAWAPLMPTLAQTWGSILNQAWVVDNGGWDGNCNDWQNYYAMNSADDPFSSIAMGTGPFALDHRTAGEEIKLVANTSYWRTDPAYTGGPSGAPALSTVWIKIISDWDTRFSMISAGTADFVDVPSTGISQMNSITGESCAWNTSTNNYDACTIDDASKPLRLYSGRPNNTQQDVIIYNFNIQ